MKKQTKVLTAAGVGLALVAGGMALAAPALAAAPAGAHQTVQPRQDNGKDGETADDTTTGAQNSNQDNGQDGETADDTTTGAQNSNQDNGQDGETQDDTGK